MAFDKGEALTSQRYAPSAMRYAAGNQQPAQLLLIRIS
jgi:hypothetical protein